MIRVHNLGIAIALAATACGGRQHVQCEQDTDCDLSGGGVCTLNSATGNRWCSYPDPQCESGYRYSDLGVFALSGDGRRGVIASAALAIAA